MKHVTLNTCIAYIAGLASLSIATPAQAADQPAADGSGIKFSEFGRVAQCPLGVITLETDDGSKLGLNGGEPYIQGDYIHVTGTIPIEFALSCTFEAGGVGIIPRLDVGTVEQAVSECGSIVAGPDRCLLFQSESGQTLALEDNGEFNIGAQVFVRGIIDPVGGDCGGVTPIVRDNLIGQCVKVTGRLVGSVSCPVLRTPDGQEYEPQHIRPDFKIGDWATINGAGASTCESCCSGDAPYVAANSIAFGFSGCGKIVETEDCGLAFEPEDRFYRSQVFLGAALKLTDFANHQPGDRVFVTGTIDGNCDLDECHDGCIGDITIGSCFKDCGTVDSVGPACVRFITDAGTVLFLDHADAFTPGQRAFVAGAFESNSACEESGQIGALRHNNIGLCLDTCGELLFGFECTPLFHPFNGGFYFSTGTAGFAFDSLVNVKGMVRENCLAGCPFTCLQSTVVTSCSPADVDSNGTINLLDLQRFIECESGPGGGVAPGCGGGDIDRDDDVDFHDFRIFQLEFDTFFCPPPLCQGGNER